MDIEPNFAYADHNSTNYFQSRRTLGNTTKASVNRFSDPEGMKAMGKNFVAFSIIAKGTDPIDYDKDYFESETDAQAYLDVMKSEDFHNKRLGLICPIVDEPEVEMKLINQINTGTADVDPKEGKLPKSDGAWDSTGSPAYTESVTLLQKKELLGLV